ncbi:MAG TPA: hypothetical protein VK614_06315 [Allosphingosinicella sp.]|nr:hypothetical protein [Allosphingosinicella sp.]
MGVAAGRCLLGSLVGWLLFLPAPAAATEFVFASAEEGGRILAAHDGFFEAMAPLEMRLRSAGPGRATTEGLRAQYRAGALAWDRAERNAWQASLDRLAPRLAAWSALLPERVLLVRVRGSVEDGIPHTRANAILLPIGAGHARAARRDFILAHEIFHLLSRAQEARHDGLYALIAFRPCRFALPAELRARRITDPDAPEERHYVQLAGGRGAYVPLQLARPVAAPPPALAESLQFLLLRVDVADGICTARRRGGGWELVAPSALPALFAVIGPNSDYLAHPEELMADNFALLLTRRARAPDQALLDRLARWLDAQVAN